MRRTYDCAYRVLDAQYYRVAQRRRRVFVVGCLGDWRRAAAVLFERQSLQGDSPPSRETGQGVAPTISARPTGGGGLGTDFDLDGGLISNPLLAKENSSHDASRESYIAVYGGGQTSGPRTVAATLAATLAAHGTRQDFDVENFVAHSLRGEGFDASEDGPGRGTPLMPAITPTLLSEGDAHSGFRDEHGLVSCGDFITQTVSLRGREGGGTAELGDDKANALRASQGGGDKPYVLADMAVRRLTPRECERLQGFPDDYTLILWRGKSAEYCPAGPRYKALGNSMAVPVMRWIGERINKVNARVLTDG